MKNNDSIENMEKKYLALNYRFISRERERGRECENKQKIQKNQNLELNDINKSKMKQYIK